MKNWKKLEKRVIFWSRAFGPCWALKIFYRPGPWQLWWKLIGNASRCPDVWNRQKKNVRNRFLIEIFHDFHSKIPFFTLFRLKTLFSSLTFNSKFSDFNFWISDWFSSFWVFATPFKCSFSACRAVIAARSSSTVAESVSVDDWAVWNQKCIELGSKKRFGMILAENRGKILSELLEVSVFRFRCPTVCLVFKFAQFSCFLIKTLFEIIETCIRSNF